MKRRRARDHYIERAAYWLRLSADEKTVTVSMAYAATGQGYALLAIATPRRAKLEVGSDA